MARVVISILDGLKLQLLLFDGDLRMVEPLEAFLDALRPSAADADAAEGESRRRTSGPRAPAA